MREFHYCKVFLPKGTLHKAIHAKVKTIPVPNSANALEVLRQLRLLEKHNAIGDEDRIEKRLIIIASLFDGVEQPTADALREQAKVVYDFYQEGG